MGLERLVEPQDADYIGKAALERIRNEGVSRKLVGIEVGGEPLAFEITEFWPAYAEGERVGHVTDLIRSPRLEKNIGYVWVPISVAEPGTELEVGMPDGSRVPARTAALPFLDPRKDIPKG
jgi:glycine cleavage system aminomethyltransferase T